MKITSVKETKGPRTGGPHNRGTEYLIYTITLDNDKTIELGIVNESNCCEEWGINIADGPEDPVGVEFTRIQVTHDPGCEDEVDTCNAVELEVSGFKFFNEDTLVQTWYCWNRHNGYYPHDIFLKDYEDNYTYENI
jgi:hypothetical protein